MATSWSTRWKVMEEYRNREVQGLFDTEQDAIDYIEARQANPNTVWDDETQSRLVYYPVQAGAISV